MTAKLASPDAEGYYAKPNNPLVMWTDGRWIYIELPSKTTPCIMKYALHEGGLWKALNTLRKHSYEFTGETVKVQVPINPKVAHALKVLKDRGTLR